MLSRSYLRASKEDQDANRVRAQVESFAAERRTTGYELRNFVRLPHSLCRRSRTRQAPVIAAARRKIAAQAAENKSSRPEMAHSTAGTGV
jgi:hypothetical protein